MPTPSQIFCKQLANDGFTPHQAQLAALQHFDALQSFILQRIHNKNLLTTVFSKLKRKPVPCIYCWGDVGQGKSLILDSFAQSLPANLVMRKHFHGFMLDINASLQQIHVPNPIEALAKKYSEKYAVICLDEFIVDNIVDAMILGKLIRALQKNGVALVTNGNTAPHNLYKEGLRRDLFMPTIQLIETSFTVIHLNTNEDFRQQQQQLPFFFQGDTERGHAFLCKHWEQITTQPISPTTLEVYQRPIVLKAMSDQAIWIDFDTLCSPPRAAKDYLYLCNNFAFILIEEAHTLSNRQSDHMYNWIKFIDICYEYKTKLIIASHVSMKNIYTGNDTIITQDRCNSRLQELLSSKYRDN